MRRMMWMLVLATLGGRGLAAEPLTTPRYHPIDITYTGLHEGDQLWVTFTHERGAAISQFGFHDGGDRFIVRFCPPEVGTWKISEGPEQHRGETVVCTPSKHAGYWIAEGRWFKRSDGSHPFIVGNTHYTLLSRRGKNGVVIPGSAGDDLRANAPFFNKVRFAVTADRYVDPTLKPFLDELGRPTDDGHFSHQPNPQWFRERVDPAVRAGFEADVICDLILCGPDTPESRSTLSNPAPWLRYVAARYGSYPNVWLCLCNEWNTKRPRYEPQFLWGWGDAVRTMQPRSLIVPRVPVSVHSDAGPWPVELNNGDWNTHVILQHKLKTIATAADAAAKAIVDGGGKPVVNDENAYQGEGDHYSEADTIEGCLGTLLGGGYASTGEKRGGKLGQYFWGEFDPAVHTAAPKLGFMRKFVDEHVAFWKMSPGKVSDVFADAPARCRVLAEAGRQYLIGSDERATITAKLPAGRWRVVQADVLGMTQRVLADNVQGEYTFTTPESRAAVTYFRLVE